MALGKRRRERQLEAFVVASDLPKSPGHPFYTALNRLLAENGFDPLVEKLCAPYYAETMGRPGVPPGVFFRMLFVGYFEGLKSHRSISWRCTDSRSLGDFLGLGPTDPVPNHSCVSKTHKRLPEEVFNEVFRFILSVAAHKGLLWGKAIGIDSTTIIDKAIDAAVNAEQAGVENDPQAIVADKGYHSTKVVTLATDLGMRAYIPERASPNQRCWTDKDPAEQRAVYNARRRTQSERGKQLSRLRSELTERSFAHVCNTGGARRTWLRGLASVTKRHLMMVAARNLSTIMRMIFGIGGPRSMQGLRALLQTAWIHFERLLSALDRLVAALVAPMAPWSRAIGG